MLLESRVCVIAGRASARSLGRATAPLFARRGTRRAAHIAHPRPVYVRRGRGRGRGRETPVYGTRFDARVGGSNTLRVGGDATVLAIGTLVPTALGRT